MAKLHTAAPPAAGSFHQRPTVHFARPTQTPLASIVVDTISGRYTANLQHLEIVTYSFLRLVDIYLGDENV